MNGFLVIARCAMDDVPLGFYKTALEAVQATHGLQKESVRQASIRIYGYTDTSNVISVCIIEFHKGKPQPFQFIRQLESPEVFDEERA